MRRSQGLALWALLASASCSYDKSELSSPGKHDAASVLYDGATVEHDGAAMPMADAPTADAPMTNLPMPDANWVLGPDSGLTVEADVRPDAGKPEAGLDAGSVFPHPEQDGSGLDGTVDVDRRMDGSADASDASRASDALRD